MCGIVGVFGSQTDRPVDSSLLKQMNDSIRHRGPDGEGFFTDGSLGFGHRRLSIIDLERGQQPMTTEDGKVTVTYNGEIYNFLELKQELEAVGHRFQTNCDTEVILHGWRQWGPACVEHFRGMFAFALWDHDKHTLFLARDRLGKKPLYYCLLDDGTLIFGSELKALRLHPNCPQTIEPTAIADFFSFGYIPDPKTIYAGIHKLPPAHRLILQRNGTPKVDAYWDLSIPDTLVDSERDATEQLIAMLEDATRIRLISDVPLGAFLSGGVDSSGVVAMMAQSSDQPVNTFSIAFDQAAFDESSYAEEMAKRYGTNHTSRRLDPEEFSLLDKLAAVYDEPFGDSSAMPTYRVCAVAREHVTVCLSGDGGDELFAGYRRYLWHEREAQLRSVMPEFLRRPLFGTLAKFYPKMDWAPRPLRAKNTFQELSMDNFESFFHSISVTQNDLRARLFSPEFRATLGDYDPSDILFGHMRKADTDIPLLQAQYADIKTFLAGGILTKVDRASMANSLEVRAPLLDHEVAQWSMSLAPKLKLNGGEGKYILKRALEPHVSKSILYRPKQGFSMPLAQWFRGPLRERVKQSINGGMLQATGYFDVETLARLAREHNTGARDHSPTLWLLLMFDSFLKMSANTGNELAKAS